MDNRKYLEKIEKGIAESRQIIGSMSAFSSESKGKTHLDPIDKSQELQSGESNKAVKAKAESRLRLLVKAKNRISEDDYGYCLTCGEDINPMRLDSVPEAENCIVCQSKLES